MNRTDPHPTRAGTSRLLTTAGLGGAAALFVGLVLMSGCMRQAEITKDPTKESSSATDPWDDVGKRLKQANDLGGCKAAINQLRRGLAERKDAPQPTGLTPDAEKSLGQVVPLTPQDLSELRGASFTSLDEIYLADCFYLRATAQSLEVAGLTPTRRAEIAFAWVCRQVYPNPWIIDGGPQSGQYVPAVPPTFILGRGYGSGLERAYVFLALLQQMNLDACLIGPPDAGTKQAGLSVMGPDGKLLTGAPKGPFWAVGVRIDNDILLFNPWRGQPFPGPNNKGVGTLAQVKANPDQLKEWFDSKLPLFGVTPDDVKKAAVFLTVPVSSLPPRMALLEEKLKPNMAVNLAEDPAALRDRIQKAVPAGTSVGFWQPADDRFAYGRVLGTFLPVEEGGWDRGPTGLRVYDLYREARVPRKALQLALQLPQELRSSDLLSRLQLAAHRNYEAAFYTPPTPRELLHRGQFNNAAQLLTEKHDAFQKGLERLRQADPAQEIAWLERAEKLYYNLSTARQPVLGGPVRPDSDPEVVAALAAIDQFWKSEAGTAQVLIDRASARVGLTEASYLMALTKNEEAERLQLQADAATGPDAPRAKAAAVNMWREAAGHWRTYLEQMAALDPFPNRQAHAKALAYWANVYANRK